MPLLAAVFETVVKELLGAPRLLALVASPMPPNHNSLVCVVVAVVPVSAEVLLVPLLTAGARGGQKEVYSASIESVDLKLFIPRDTKQVGAAPQRGGVFSGNAHEPQKDFLHDILRAVAAAHEHGQVPKDVLPELLVDLVQYVAISLAHQPAPAPAASKLFQNSAGGAD